MAALLYQWLLPVLFWLPAAGPSAPAAAASYHPFYISVSEINHNAAEQTLEISSKLFAEDLEEILKKNYKTVLDLDAARDKAKAEELIRDYFAKHFVLLADGKARPLQFIGFEKDKESAYCYFQVEKVPAVHRIDIQNSLLYDFNETQINIMHVTVQGRRQSNKVSFPARLASFQF